MQVIACIPLMILSIIFILGRLIVQLCKILGSAYSVTFYSQMSNQYQDNKTGRFCLGAKKNSIHIKLFVWFCFCKPCKLISSGYNLSELNTSPNTNMDPNLHIHLVQSSNKGSRGNTDYGVLKDPALVLFFILLSLRLR